MKTYCKWGLALLLPILLLLGLALWPDAEQETDAGDLHAQIEQVQDKQYLLTLAWENEAGVKVGLISPMQFSAYCILLAQKLGFGITIDRLNQETDAILKDGHLIFYVVTWPLGDTAAMDEESYFFAVGKHSVDSASYNTHAPRQEYVDALKAAIRVSAANADEAIAIAEETRE